MVGGPEDDRLPASSSERGFPADRATVAGQAGLLLAAAILLTVLSWSLRPDRLPLRADTSVYELELAAPMVDMATALALYEEGLHVFVDTRPTAAAAASGLAVPGAVPVRQDSFDDDLLAVFDFMGPDDPLVLYDDGGLLGASNIAARLVERGFGDLSIMAGGVAAWREAGGETTRPATDPEDGS